MYVAGASPPDANGDIADPADRDHRTLPAARCARGPAANRAYAEKCVQPNGGPDAAVGVRVRVLPREEIVFAAHTATCGLELPDQGPFELEIDLQMNVGPGTYRAQAVAWDLRDRTRGLARTVDVDRGRIADRLRRDWYSPLRACDFSTRDALADRDREPPHTRSRRRFARSLRRLNASR